MSKSSEKICYPFDPIPLEFLRSKKIPPQIKLFIPIFRSFIHRGNEPDFNIGESLRGYGFPSNKTLAEVSGYSVSYIKYIKRIFKKMDLIELIRRDGASSLYVVKSYELILQELENGDDYKKMCNKFSDEVRQIKEEVITEEEIKYKEKAEDYQNDQIFQHLIEDQGFDPDDLNGHYSGGHTVTQGCSHGDPSGSHGEQGVVTPLSTK